MGQASEVHVVMAPPLSSGERPHCAAQRPSGFPSRQLHGQAVCLFPVCLPHGTADSAQAQPSCTRRIKAPQDTAPVLGSAQQTSETEE